MRTHRIVQGMGHGCLPSALRDAADHPRQCDIQEHGILQRLGTAPFLQILHGPVPIPLQRFIGVSRKGVRTVHGDGDILKVQLGPAVGDLQVLGHGIQDPGRHQARRLGGLYFDVHQNRIDLPLVPDAMIIGAVLMIEDAQRRIRRTGRRRSGHRDHRRPQQGRRSLGQVQSSPAPHANDDVAALFRGHRRDRGGFCRAGGAAVPFFHPGYLRRVQS